MLHVNDFQAINGRFSNKPSFENKEALFENRRNFTAVRMQSIHRPRSLYYHDYQ